MTIALTDPDIHPILFKTTIQGFSKPIIQGNPGVILDYSQYKITPSIGDALAEFIGSYVCFGGYYGYAYYNKNWVPITLEANNRNVSEAPKYEVIVLLLKAIKKISGEGGTLTDVNIYFDNLLWSDLDEEYQSMKATWDDINT